MPLKPKLLLALAAMVVGCVGPESSSPSEKAEETSGPVVPTATTRKPTPATPTTKEPSTLPRFIVDRESGIRLVLVRPGKYVYRNTSEGETQESTYVVKKAFYIGVCEVSQAQWSRVMESNPSQFKHPDNPVESVTLVQVKEFLWKTGLRLPTETEWTVVARMEPGTQDGSASAAWHAGNSGGRPRPICTTRPNSAGVFDILGNVAEMVDDERDWDFPTTHARQGPPDVAGRGGSFATKRDDCDWQHGIEYWVTANKSDEIGFRVAKHP